MSARRGMAAPQALAALAASGGAVRRGECYPDLVGRYFYTDHRRGGLCSPRLAPDPAPGGAVLEEREEEGAFPGGVASLHAGYGGALDVTTTSGNVYHLEARP